MSVLLVVDAALVPDVKPILLNDGTIVVTPNLSKGNTCYTCYSQYTHCSILITVHIYNILYMIYTLSLNMLLSSELTLYVLRSAIIQTIFQ